MKNTKYFMMLTLLAVGSINVQADGNVETQHHVDKTFLGQMHKIQNEISHVRGEARDCSRAESNGRLAMVESAIQALNINPEYKNADLHDHRIRVLNTELDHAERFVKKHGLANRDVV